jgi:hypothetical protein
MCDGELAKDDLLRIGATADAEPLNLSSELVQLIGWRWQHVRRGSPWLTHGAPAWYLVHRDFLLKGC